MKPCGIVCTCCTEAIVSVLWPFLLVTYNNMTLLQRNLSGNTRQGETDIAAHNFCNLLVWLQDVFLQDLPLLVRAYPDHFMWQHEAFAAILNHPRWPAFEQRIYKAHDQLDKAQAQNAKTVSSTCIMIQEAASMLETIAALGGVG
jgi:hypothetical protein